MKITNNSNIPPKGYADYLEWQREQRKIDKEKRNEKEEEYD
jgi:hypothetical protein